MEIAKSLHSPFLLLLLPLLLLYVVDARSSSVDGANRHHDKLILDLQKLPWNQQKGKAAANCIFQKPKVEKGATTLQMKERDYCSGEVIEWEKNLQDRLILDNIHVSALQSRIASAISPNNNKPLEISESRIPLSPGSRVNILNYIVTVGIGGRNFTLIVDTGTDLTWVQCRPCRLCYDQQEPIFDPSNSTSFHFLPCNSSACWSLVYGTCGARPTSTSRPCNYEIKFGDGSFSQGDLAFESLTFGNVTVENFVIGCGQRNKGKFGAASGFLGLARDNLSLLSQTSSLSVFGGIFSYCLPGTGAGASGSLTLGAGDFSNFRNVSPISYTRLISNPKMSNYYLLNLTGISIGGVKVDAPRLASNIGVVTLIDSGTVITRLPPSVHKVFTTEFEKQCSRFQKAPGFSILNTCYNLTGFNKVDVPPVKFYFEGDAEQTVDAEGIFYFLKTDSSRICLAFASAADEDRLAIIGNFQQKNQRVVYNTKENKLGFAPEPCTF